MDIGYTPFSDTAKDPQSRLQYDIQIIGQFFWAQFWESAGPAIPFQPTIPVP